MDKEKIICPHCGREIPWDSMFCPYCGYTLYPQQNTSEIRQEQPERVVTKTRYKTKYRKKRKKDTGKIIRFTVKVVILIILILLGMNLYNRYGDDVKAWIHEKISSRENQEDTPVQPVTQPDQSEQQAQEDTPVPTAAPIPSAETEQEEDTSSQTEKDTTESTEQGTE